MPEARVFEQGIGLACRLRTFRLTLRANEIREASP
jgi:hypothetical protein